MTISIKNLSFISAVIIVTLAFSRVLCAQTTKPMQSPGPDVRVVLAAPQWSPDGKSFTLPAAFWNEHLTDWLD
ncbi:MAG TPA: hypothetical protein VKJ65_05010, partial [Phycisphaerae bacterium]|nr:hypothetical protein [Phycisphaerae bacterium]